MQHMKVKDLIKWLSDHPHDAEITLDGGGNGIRGYHYNGNTKWLEVYVTESDDTEPYEPYRQTPDFDELDRLLND